ncbi:MAG TPA: carboxymuconolactone decarboxylase family protein [Acidimicrobiales bacterium]|nr:carboxymuconolactone decarboxylase family protein [Acidimicrobiales bacterium]
MLDRAVARAATLVTHTTPPRVFRELGRHPRLFRAWLPFAGALLLHGELPRIDTELVILRTACNCGSRYEWAQHVALARRAGLDAAQIDVVPEGASATAWSARQRELLRAVDELHADRTLSPATRERLEQLLTERQLIELCLLVGHYEMLAMLLNTRGVEPDAPSHGCPFSR